MGNSKSSRPKKLSNLFEQNQLQNNLAKDNAEVELQRPTQREFEKSRRQTVKEQIPRTERLKQWNINDLSPDSDYFPPKTRIQTLRRLSEESGNMNRGGHIKVSPLQDEVVHKKRVEFDSGRIFAQSDAKLRERQGQLNAN